MIRRAIEVIDTRLQNSYTNIGRAKRLYTFKFIKFSHTIELRSIVIPRSQERGQFQVIEQKERFQNVAAGAATPIL